MPSNLDTQVQKNGHGHEGFPWKHVIGYISSLVLTFIAFWIGLYSGWSIRTIIYTLITLAVIQILVQLFMFMHITESDGSNYQTILIIFGFFLCFAVLAGTAWIIK